MRRRLNIKVALWTLATLILLAACLHAVHSMQMAHNADGLLRQAERALEKKQPELALRHLHHYLTYRPDDLEALTQYALLLDEHARNEASFTTAVLKMQEVLRQRPDGDALRHRLLLALARLRRFSEAIEQADLLRTTWPNKGEMEHIIGWCYEHLKLDDKAAEWYRNAIAASGQRIDTYVKLREVLERGQGDPEQIAALMNEMIANNPESARAALVRHRYYLKADALKEAEKDLQRALELAPEDANVLLTAAEWAQRHGRAEEARKYLQRGLIKHPSNEAIYKGLAGLDIAAGNKPAARSMVQAGLKELPKSWDLQVMLAELTIDEDDLGEAEKIVAELRKRGVTSPLPDYLSARLLVQRRQWAEAIPLLEKVRSELEPGSEWASRTNALLGVCYQQIGDGDQQLASFRRAAQLEPGWTAARLGHGTALLTQGRLEEALVELQQACKSSDAPVAAWNELARCLLARNLRQPNEKRDWNALGKVLDRAEKIQATLESTLIRAEVEAVQKRYLQAEQILDKARVQFPNQVGVECALADLVARQTDVIRAELILAAAQKKFGDVLPIRRARLRLWALPTGPDARRNLERLAEELEGLPLEDRVRFLRELADAWARRGEPVLAERLWRRVLAEQPRDLAGRLQLLDIYLQAHQLDLARTLIDELRTLEGDRGTHWRHAMAALLVTEFPGDAKKLGVARMLLVEALGMKRDWGRLYQLQGRIDELEGRIDEALTHYQTAFDLGERSLRLVYRLVQLLQQRGNFTAAEAILRKLEEQIVLPAELARLGAEAALANSNFARALTLAAQAVPADSRDYRDFLWLGRIQQAAGQAHKAETYLRQAVALAGHTPDTWIGLVDNLARRGEIAAANTAMDEARKKIAPQREAFTLARCFDVLGDLDQASAYYRKALAARPDDFILLAAAADFFLRADRPLEAEPLLRKLLATEIAAPAELVVKARRQLALILAASTDAARHQQAVELLTLNQKLRGPNLADARAFALVEGFATANKVEAVRKFKETLGSRPATAEETFQLARLCASFDPLQAHDLLAGLVTNHPDNPQYLAHYLRTFEAGDPEAIPYFRRLEKREPRSPRTAELRKMFMP